MPFGLSTDDYLKLSEAQQIELARADSGTTATPIPASRNPRAQALIDTLRTAGVSGFTKGDNPLALIPRLLATLSGVPSTAEAVNQGIQGNYGHALIEGFTGATALPFLSALKGGSAVAGARGLMAGRRAPQTVSEALRTYGAEGQAAGLAEGEAVSEADAALSRAGVIPGQRTAARAQASQLIKSGDTQRAIDAAIKDAQQERLFHETAADKAAQAILEPRAAAAEAAQQESLAGAKGAFGAQVDLEAQLKRAIADINPEKTLPTIPELIQSKVKTLYKKGLLQRLPPGKDLEEASNAIAKAIQQGKPIPYDLLTRPRLPMRPIRGGAGPLPPTAPPKPMGERVMDAIGESPVSADALQVPKAEPLVFDSLKPFLPQWLVGLMASFTTPKTFLSTEVAGSKFGALLRSVERGITGETNRLTAHLIRITKGLSEESLDRIRQSLDRPSMIRKTGVLGADGKPIFETINNLRIEALTPQEQKVSKEFRKVYDYLAERNGYKPGEVPADYFPKVFWENKAPRDFIEIRAAEIASKGQGDQRPAALLQAFRELPADQQGKLMRQVADTYKHIPEEQFFGNISRARLTAIQPENPHLLRDTIYYIHGASRKAHIDHLITEMDPLLPEMSDQMKRFSINLFQSFRGVPEASEAIKTRLGENVAQWLENKGHPTLALTSREIFIPRELSKNIRKLQFASKLGLNLSSVAINLTQPLNIVTEAGTVRALGALKEYVRGGEELKKLLERAGITFDPSSAAETLRLFGGEKLTDRIANFVGIPFQMSENANRGWAFLVGYRKIQPTGFAKVPEHLTEELKHVASDFRAIQEGQAMVDKTQFAFTRSNIPLAFQTPTGAVLSQFKSFMVFQLRFIKNTMREAMPTVVNGKTVLPDPENVKKAFRMMGGIAAVGGGKAFVPGMFGMGWIANLKESDLDETAQNMIIGGLPRAAGVDISGQLGIGVLPRVTTQGGVPDPMTAIQEMLGPTYGSAKNVFSVVNAWMRGDPDARQLGLQTLMEHMPGGLAFTRAYKVYAGTAVGEDTKLRPRGGGALVTEETPQQKALRAVFGSKTTNVAQEYETTQFLREKDRALNQRNENIRRRIQLEGPRNARSIVMQEQERSGLMTPPNLRNINERLIQGETPMTLRTFNAMTPETQALVIRQYPSLARKLQAQRTGIRPALSERYGAQ